MSLVWYFAYGRNVDPSILSNRIRSKPLLIHRGILPGYCIEFTKTPGPTSETGWATIVPCAKEWVEGALYLISSDQLNLLDRCEGYPHHYTREEVLVWNIDLSEWVSAITYIAVNRDPRLKPPRRYLETIIKAAKTLKLSSPWISKLEKALNEAI